MKFPVLFDRMTEALTLAEDVSNRFEMRRQPERDRFTDELPINGLPMGYKRSDIFNLVTVVRV